MSKHLVVGFYEGFNFFWLWVYRYLTFLYSDRLSTGSVDSNHNVIATAKGIFDSSGGTLTSDETGVSVVIPAGAIPEGIKQEIYFKVCQDNKMAPPLDPEKGFFKAYNSNKSDKTYKNYMNYLKGETLLSPIVMCGPHGLRFEVPVELRLPHCASVNPESWSFALKSSDTSNG
jgi:tight junction protein 1